MIKISFHPDGSIAEIEAPSAAILFKVNRWAPKIASLWEDNKLLSEQLDHSETWREKAASNAKRLAAALSRERKTRKALLKTDLDKAISELPSRDDIAALEEEIARIKKERDELRDKLANVDSDFDIGITFHYDEPYPNNCEIALRRSAKVVKIDRDPKVRLALDAFRAALAQASQAYSTSKAG